MVEPVRLRFPKTADLRPKTAADRQVIVHEKPLGRSHAYTVYRRLDTIEQLYRHHGLDPRQYAAAERCRIAFERCEGSTRCALDLTVAAGTSGNRMLPREQVEAAATVREIKSILGVIDGRVVELVCGLGLTLAETAERMGYRADRARNWIGHRLREGLQALADAWSPIKRRGLRCIREPGARPTIPTTLPNEFERTAFGELGLIKPGLAAHATSYRVDYVRGCR